jgi:hypothetical protein
MRDWFGFYLKRGRRYQREVIRIRNSKKNRQHNGQKKKHKRTNNDLMTSQNVTGTVISDILERDHLTRQVPLWEQELLTHLEHLSSPRFLVGFVLLNLYQNNEIFRYLRIGQVAF